MVRILEDILVNKLEKETHRCSFVRLSSFDDARFQFYSLCRKVISDPLSEDFVDLVVDDSKTPVVVFWVYSSRFEHLQVARVKECSVGNHVDIVRNWKSIDVSPTFRRSHNSGFRGNCR